MRAGPESWASASSPVRLCLDTPFFAIDRKPSRQSMRTKTIRKEGKKARTEEDYVQNFREEYPLGEPAMSHWHF